MANSEVNIKQIPLIYASKEVLEKKKRAAWYEAAFCCAGSISLLGFGAHSIGLIFVETAALPQAVFFGLLSVSCGLVTYLLIKNARFSYDNYCNYSKFIKEGQVDLNKIAKPDSVEFAMASFIQLGNVEEGKPYGKIYVDKILKDSWPFTENIIHTDAVYKKKSYLDIFLPYTSSYLSSMKVFYMRGLLFGVVSPIILISVFMVESSVFAIDPALGISLGISILYSSAFTLGLAYYAYQSRGFYSKLSSEVEFADQYFAPDGKDVFDRHKNMDLRPGMKDILYGSQDTLNRLLYRLVPEKSEREDVVLRFVDIVQQSRAGANVPCVN